MLVVSSHVGGIGQIILCNYHTHTLIKIGVLHPSIMVQSPNLICTLLELP